MNFFNKLENKDINSNNTNIQSFEQNNDLQNGGYKNNNLTDNNLNNDKDTINSNILQDNIIKFKKYIEFLDNDQHYFINYNNCYKISNDIIELSNNNNKQEIKNNIKLLLSKYKQTKSYSIKLNNENILIYDIKKKSLVDKINLPICLDLEIIHDIELKKLNNIYSKTRLAYNLLLENDNVLESKLNEFKKLRSKCEKSINNYYIVQYLLNKMKKNNIENKQYTTHSVEQVYNANKDIIQTLLILRNKNIKQDVINKIIEEESILLNEYIEIKRQLQNKSDTQDDSEIKSNIKKYLIMKKDLSNKINKINSIKNKEITTIIYLNKEELQSLNFKPFTSYYNSLVNKSFVTNTDSSNNNSNSNSTNNSINN